MAVNFDGVTQRLLLNGVTIPTTVTFSLWVRLNAGGSLQRIFGSNGDFELRTNASNQLTGDFFGTGSTGTTALVVGEWTHVLITADAGTDTSQIFINGVLDVTTTGLTDTDTGPILSIGGRYGLEAELANVACGDFRIYNRLLSAGEAQTIYTARGHDGIAQGLLARYVFEEKPSGQSVNPLLSQQDNSVGSATSIVVPAPSNSDGNLLVAFIAATGSGDPGPVITAPAGWALANSGNISLPSTFSTPTIHVFYKTASGEPANYTFNSNITASLIGTVSAYDNLGGNVLQNLPATISTGTSASPSNPSVVAGARSLVLRVMCADDNDGLDASPIDSTSRLFDTQTGQGNGLSLGIVEQILPSGATGTADWTLSASEQWGALTFIFNSPPLPVLDISGNGNNAQPIDDPLYEVDVLSFRRKTRSR